MIEAGFQREYGIELAQALPTMSWRRFQVLLRGMECLGAIEPAPLEGKAALAAFHAL